MRNVLRCILSVAVPVYAVSAAQIEPVRGYAITEPGTYYWKSAAVGSTAELLTLFCRECTVGQDAPLLAVLRDTLGDSDVNNDHLTSVWLLDYSPQNWRQRTLAAIPFFYWHVGKGSAKPEKGDVKPLLNLSSPLHPLMSQLNQSIVQWGVFDPMTTAVRASSRSYRENEADHERLHLQEAISYLSEAPVSTPGALKSDFTTVGVSQDDLDFLIARLSLRKRILGGLVTDAHAGEVGERERIAQERIRLRNWELLRQAAEKTGLLFEPMSLAGTREDYAILWFPINSSPPSGYRPDNGPLWKILDVKDPWKDAALRQWSGLTFNRNLTATGSLSPQGENSQQGKQVTLVPIAAYNLNYPRMPLLMVDFRSQSHIRRHELEQRGIDQLVNGVIGISHFANWYYFVGSDLYSFIASRHGTAQNRAARLDCYSEFRAELAVDTDLPPELRTEMQRRLSDLGTNPLEADPQSEVAMAKVRYANLQTEANDGKLAKRLDAQRREELASFGRGPTHLAFDAFFHAASFGLYTHSERPNPELLAKLDRTRRIQTDLAYLSGVAASGTQPEISYDHDRIDASVNDLSSLLPAVKAERVKAAARRDLNTIERLTRDDRLRADCQLALRASDTTTIATETRAARQGIVEALAK